LPVLEGVGRDGTDLFHVNWGFDLRYVLLNVSFQ